MTVATEHASAETDERGQERRADAGQHRGEDKATSQRDPAREVDALEQR